LIDEAEKNEKTEEWRKDWEYRFYWRRLINAEYFRDIRLIIEGGEYK